MKSSMRTALTFIAGYCDTATFIHMDGVFSAHITGNFILFAAALAQGLEAKDYLKIITFPVFLFAIVFATFLYRRLTIARSGYHRLLYFMTCLLIICGILAGVPGGSHGTLDPGGVDIVITLLLVTALATQNALHHFIPGPMTTVMTGTVMNTTAALTEKYLLKSNALNDNSVVSVRPSLWMILSFALGCVISGFATYHFGLTSIVVPAIMMSCMILMEKDNLH